MDALQMGRFAHSATNWSPEGNPMLLTLILVGERANPSVAMFFSIEG